MTTYIAIAAGAAVILAALALMFWAAVHAAKSEGIAQANVDHAKAETKTVADAVGAAHEADIAVDAMSRRELDERMRPWIRPGK